SSAELDDEALQQDARVAGRSLEIEIGPEYRAHARSHSARSGDRKLRPRYPPELAQNFFRRRACVEQQRKLPKRSARVTRLDRIGHRPVVLERGRTDDLTHVVDRDRLLAERVEEQPFDVVAQPL